MVKKLRDLIFGYVVTVIMTVMSIIFQGIDGFYKKLQPNSFNIAPIELKLGL